MAKSDADLVVDTLNGDSRAFEEIIRRYQRLVFNIAFHYVGRRNEVEDLAQEVFLKVYRTLDRFDRDRPLKAWIGKITSNTCLDEIRKARSRRLSFFSDLSEEEQERVEKRHSGRPGHSAEGFDTDGSLRMLHEAVSELPDKDRMAFVLRDLERLEYAEIAEALGTSQVAIRIRVSRVRKRIQHRLREMMQNRGV